MRPQLRSLIKNPKFVRRSRWYHLNFVFQLFNPFPTHTSVVFERRISDVERIFDIAQLFYALCQSGGWVFVFTLIDGAGQIFPEIFLGAESLVP